METQKDSVDILLYGQDLEVKDQENSQKKEENDAIEAIMPSLQDIVNE